MERLRAARADVQRGLRRARSDWVASMSDSISDGANGAVVWDSVRKLRDGLDGKPRPPAAKMKKADGSLASYAYLASERNRDFEPGLALLSRQNAVAEHVPPADASVPATACEQLLPYANTCGLLALPTTEPAALRDTLAAVRRAAAVHAPRRYS